MESTLIADIRQTVEKFALIEKGGKIGIGVSGGRDSVALFHALFALSKEMDFEICVLHFEHGIRGEESKADMDFVKAMAEAAKVPFYCEEGDLLSREGNLEENARLARYAFFERITKEANLSAVAVAHHRDDAAETFILNLLRGSGTDGLSGMNVRRAPNIIRPMLFCSRSAVDEFIEQGGYEYREDATNKDTRYARNYVRHELLPAMHRLNPAAETAILRSAMLIAEEADANETRAAELFREVKITDGIAELPKRILLSEHPAVAKRILRMAVAKVATLKDVESAHIERTLALAAKDAGKTFECGIFFARSRAHSLIIGAKLYTIEVAAHPEPIAIREGSFAAWEGVNVEVRINDGSPADFYADDISELCIRTRAEGDVIKTRRGKKPLKKWFIDKKIPREERDGIVLIAKGNTVLWLNGNTENMITPENGKWAITITKEK